MQHSHACFQAKANLHKFIEAFHQKASNLTSWITSLEVPANPCPTPRMEQQLAMKYYSVQHIHETRNHHITCSMLFSEVLSGVQTHFDIHGELLRGPGKVPTLLGGGRNE